MAGPPLAASIGKWKVLISVIGMKITAELFSVSNKKPERVGAKSYSTTFSYVFIIKFQHKSDQFAWNLICVYD